jgi:hypothetical protein
MTTHPSLTTTTNCAITMPNKRSHDRPVGQPIGTSKFFRYNHINQEKMISLRYLLIICCKLDQLVAVQQFQNPIYDKQCRKCRFWVRKNTPRVPKSTCDDKPWVL